MFEGVPTYPDAGRFWQICREIQGHRVFYTAPTAIRSLIRWARSGPQVRPELPARAGVGRRADQSRGLDVVLPVIGKERCPIVDTWWQTETGAFLITPLPGATPQARQRQPPVLRRRAGRPARRRHRVRPERGRQALHQEAVARHDAHHVGRPRPLHRHLLHDVPDMYFTGDGCRIDEDGDYWLMGRIDDVVNVSGHRIGTAEVESALVSHPKVAEAAVAPMPHDIKGQALYAFVTLGRRQPSDELKKELVKHVRKEIGPIAAPDKIQFAPGLPKTRSGKIMRRILRKIAENAPTRSATPPPWPIRTWFPEAWGWTETDKSLPIRHRLPGVLPGHGPGRTDAGQDRAAHRRHDRRRPGRHRDDPGQPHRPPRWATSSASASWPGPASASATPRPRRRRSSGFPPPRPA
jgi:acetyl-CoA synthetase